MAARKQDRLRESLAHEAAKIIVAEGVHDYQKAKRKACERLNALRGGSLPSNLEIESAILSFLRTYLPGHERTLWGLRCTALTVMSWLVRFSPYLTGPVLEGTAGADTPISIHVSCDCLEEVMTVLECSGMEVKVEERRFRQNRHYACLPVLGFSCQGHEIEIMIFSLRQRHQPPKSKTCNRSAQRMNTKALATLLDQTRLDMTPARTGI